MEKIILEIKKRGIKKFEIFYEKRIREDIGFVQNEAERFEEKNEEGIGIRIIKDGKRGFTHTNLIQQPEKIVEKAIQSASYGKEIDIDFPSEKSEREIKIFYDEEWGAEERIKIGNDAVKRITSLYKDLKIDANFRKEIVERRILNSSGLDLSYRKSLFSYYIQVMGLTPSGIVYIFELDGKLKPDFNFEKKIEEILYLLERCKNAEKIKSGKYPVIFSPFSIDFFIRAITLGIDGRNFEKGITPLKDKRGERILSEKITIYDDPEREDLTGSAPFDGEGTPTQKFTFIEKGILKDFLADLETSKRTGIKARGNGLRNTFESLPLPSFNNMVIEKGDKSLEQILKEINKGIIVYETIGAGQSNILAGEYAFNLGLAFLIERGEIKGRIKDAMVSGNIYEDFKKVLYVSKETKKFYSYDIPYICVDEIKVTG